MIISDKPFDINIPKGIENGSIVKVSGKGEGVTSRSFWRFVYTN